MVMGNCFEAALEESVQPYDDVYVAVVTPIGGIHDRACELYQQLVGINFIKKGANLDKEDNGPELVKAVYGYQHYHEEHTQ
jgi:hypothetical protein